MLTPPRQLIVPLSFNRYVYFSSLILRDLYFWLFKHRCLFVYTQLQFCTWYLNQPCCLCITSITTWYRLNLILCLLSVFYNLINKCIWFFIYEKIYSKLAILKIKVSWPWYEFSAPDAIQCSMCHSPVGPMYCEVCVRNVKKHIYLIYMQVHKVVSFKQYWRYLNYPNCRKRPTKQYELWYKQCGIHICTKSNSSGKHLGHKNLIFSKSLKVKSSC